MHTLTKPTEAAMTAIAEKMAEQWEVKFRKITTDINCAIHGLTQCATSLGLQAGEG